MAFLALVDKYVLSDKSVLDYDSQNPEKAVENLKLAFDLATKKMNVPKILSATDVAAGNVDDRSMVLALSMYYHAFQQEEKRQELENQRRMLEENERRAKEQADRAKEQADRAKEEADEANVSQLILLLCSLGNILFIIVFIWKNIFLMSINLEIEKCK